MSKPLVALSASSKSATSPGKYSRVRVNEAYVRALQSVGLVPLVIPPSLSPDEAREMIAGTRVARLLDGFRGAPRGDLDALVDTLLRLSRLALDLGDRIREIDINPLIVLERAEGVRAVDALVVAG